MSRKGMHAVPLFLGEMQSNERVTVLSYAGGSLTVTLGRFASVAEQGILVFELDSTLKAGSSGGTGKRNTGALTYWIDLATPNSVPELPPNGLSDVSDLAKLKRVRTMTAGIVGPGRTHDTYAYVKETVQRNPYRVPLR